MNDAPNIADLGALARLCERLVGELPADALPDLIAALEASKARALARVMCEARPVPEPPPALIDAAALARRLNVAETWVRDAARRGVIPVVHAGVHVRFDPVDVLAAMKAGKAALADRSKLSTRGRRAQEHRIQSPVRPKNASKHKGSSEPATSLLPPTTTAAAPEATGVG